MTPKVNPTVEKWEELHKILQSLTADVMRGKKSQWEALNEYEPQIQSLLSLSVQEAKAELAEYCEHQDNCILSYWSAGRPTKNGGYERKYGEKWYQSRPVDKTPKCTCGLDNLLSTPNTKEVK